MLNATHCCKQTCQVQEPTVLYTAVRDTNGRARQGRHSRETLTHTHVYVRRRRERNLGLAVEALKKPPQRKRQQAETSLGRTAGGSFSEKGGKLQLISVALLGKFYLTAKERVQAESNDLTGKDAAS